MPIPTIFFTSFLTWGSHNHFIGIRNMIGEPIWKSIVWYGSSLHFLPYSNNPPNLCFPFVGEWYTYSRFHIKCGSYFFYDCSMSFQHYTSRNLHIFNYNLQLIFSCKWHLQLKSLIAVLDKLHKTLIIKWWSHDDVIT